MPEYLPLGSFRQGLLPGDCHSCSWWQTSGPPRPIGDEAAGIRHEWLVDLEHEWGSIGLLAHEPTSRRNSTGSTDPVIIAAIHFAPASSLPRFRELPFPALPPFSALLFCLRVEKDSPRWVAKRIIRRALYELRGRGIEEVYAVANRPGNGDTTDCRFFSPDLLEENGFMEVAASGSVALMRVESRGLLSLLDQVEATFRRIFIREEEPAPSPAAWVERKDGAA